MFETLWEAISQVRDKDDVQIFLNDLLSPIERVMIAKRLAIAALLLKGNSYETIKDFLKVSTETVAKISLILKMNKGYQLAINKLIRTEAGKQFWQEIENLLYRLSSPGKVFLPEEAVKYKLGHKKKTLV
ncbi:hypothetical protein A3C33_02270 [Candidatus Curtissbacteria bacterium RIFCSPHIGHO2_02_FULL_42_58]|nr:MAG: hypothetical protein A3C33_02270 [Candidatus Curtissbacteria bacterium RIFCSPHIGHO2_02_FULL_42_58]OGD96423.1 MAG: hypothetical protein A3E71_02410 [Candidatus Curtissbacteria bacterium RIFCSPHIGHO2_12_FULL_42_33]